MSRWNHGERIDVQLLRSYEMRVINWVEMAAVTELVVDNYARHLLRLLVDDDFPTHMVESSLARVLAEHPFIVAKSPALRCAIDRLKGRL